MTTNPTASAFAAHPDHEISCWALEPLPCISITSGRRVFPSYFGGTCRMYDRAMPLLWIINVLLPGFNVLVVQGPCAAPVSVMAASAASPPASDTAPASWVPPVPDDAPLVSIDPLVAGTPVPAVSPVAPVAPPVPPVVAGTPVPGALPVAPPTLPLLPLVAPITGFWPCPPDPHAAPHTVIINPIANVDWHVPFMTGLLHVPYCSPGDRLAAGFQRSADLAGCDQVAMP